MWDLVRSAREEPDPSFFFKEFTSDPTHPLDCKHCEVQANPALKAGFLDRGSMATARKRMRPSEYRRLRLGQWLPTVEDQFLSAADLTSIGSDQSIPMGARVVVGMDGSINGDTTALTLATVDEVPLLDVARVWNPATEQDEDYRVPVLEVEDEIRLLCSKYDVVEIVCDPWQFRRSMEVLQSEGYPVVEHPQSRSRMGPLTASFYEAVANRLVKISAAPILRMHLLNCRVIETPQGPILRKEAPKSTKKIDVAVSALMAYGRAAHLAKQKQKRRRVHSW